MLNQTNIIFKYNRNIKIKKVKKFIYASSSSVYGDTKIYPFRENDFKNILFVYGAKNIKCICKIIFKILTLNVLV